MTDDELEAAARWILVGILLAIAFAWLGGLVP